MDTTSKNNFPPDRFVHPSWKPILSPVFDHYWPHISATIGTQYLPGPDHLLRAFAQPQDQVKVLILGQDPYPTPGHSMGLAFSTTAGTPPPRSLVNIYRELHTDLGIDPPHHGNLEAWENQGVLLLNRTLSVAPGQPGSHRGIGWEEITDAAISSLNRTPMVAILWGKEAQKSATLLPNVPIISSAHPSPLSARRGFFGSRPFSRTNDYLRHQGASPIDWRL